MHPLSLAANRAAPRRRTAPRTWILPVHDFHRLSRRRDAILLEVGLGPAPSRDRPSGARWLDLSRLECPHSLNRLPVARLREHLRGLGVRADSLVLLAGRDPMAQYRAGWILEVAGVTRLRFLDGGLESWRRAGLPTDSGPIAPFLLPRVFDEGASETPTCALDREDVARRLSCDDVQLVDIRSLAERRGRTSGYPYFAARGTIPGSLWGGGGTRRDELEDLRGPGRTMVAAPALDAFWRRCGLRREKQVVFFCGTGWRASEAYWFARELGFPRVAVYDGGWYEWSRAAGVSA